MCLLGRILNTQSSFNVVNFSAEFWFLHYVQVFASEYSQRILFVFGLNNTSTLVGHFELSPEKRRKDIEEIVEEMKEKDRRERGK